MIGPVAAGIGFLTVKAQAFPQENLHEMTSPTTTESKVESSTASGDPAEIKSMNIRIYNTLTRTKEPFEPITPGKVGIYLCGPTVYDKAHIGHMVGPVAFDTLKRFLVYCGYETRWVVNITDVDDKLIARSSERGISMDQLAKEMTTDYLSNLAGMGVDQIDDMPRATDCMQDIIDFTASLIEQGYAYAVEGDVFFDVAKNPEYGKLTNRTTDQLQGEGGEVGAKKKSLADFTLWKAAKPGEPSWDSPWGPGRPGWHIECSAMSRALLGESFDIHGGGLDLIFPHHENEIAQSECRHAKPMAKYWMHNGLLRREKAGKIGGRGEQAEADSMEAVEQATEKKESRSKGGGGLAEMIQVIGGEQLRFFLLRTHYRSTVILNDESLAEAKSSLETFYRFFERFERVTGDDFYAVSSAQTRIAGAIDACDDELLSAIAKNRDGFLAKMDDDFNTGGACSELFELVRTLNKSVDQNRLEEKGADERLIASLKRAASTLRELASLLGLFLLAPEKDNDAGDSLAGSLMELLIELRAESRKNKDFAMSDRIRDGLKALGVTLEDRKEGTTWRQES